MEWKQVNVLTPKDHTNVHVVLVMCGLIYNVKVLRFLRQYSNSRRDKPFADIQEIEVIFKLSNRKFHRDQGNCDSRLYSLRVSSHAKALNKTDYICESIP